MSTATVTVPEPTEQQRTVAICEHVRDNGRRCGSPAIRNRHFCYHHSRAHAPAPRPGSRYYRAPLPETIESLQLLIMQVTEALGSGQISDRTAGKFLYAVQLSTNLLKMSKAETPLKQAAQPEPIVTEIPPAMEEVLAAQTAPPPTTPDDADYPRPEPVVADDDPEMPVTVEEAQRLLLPARILVDHYEYLRGADRASSRYQKTQRRLALHQRAYSILDEHGLTRDYLNEVGDAGVLATHRRETREKAEARILRGNPS